VNNLPLDDCRELAARGMPQGAAEHVWIVGKADNHYASRSDACVVYGFNPDDPALIDAYTVGELLDWIHAHYDPTDVSIEKAGLRWYIELIGIGNRSDGASLIQAVANLVKELLRDE